jgi:hypothetical protein
MSGANASKNRRIGHLASAALLALLVPALGGCDQAPDELAPTESALSLGSIMYDGPGFPTTTLCNGMHCCPEGRVMVAAHLSRNVFACAAGSYQQWLGAPPNENVPIQFDGPGYVDGQSTTTNRLGMHTCLPGYVMVGYHQGYNWLMCRRPLNPSINQASEYVDYGSQNTGAGFSMHSCNQNAIQNPYRYAMTGIHAGQNKLACAY